MRIAAKTTESAALLPNIKISISAATAPIPKIVPAHVSGFFSFFLYNSEVKFIQIIPKIGKTTPLNIEIVFLRLYTSVIYEGIHVATPSRSMPCKTIPSIIPKISGEKNLTFSPLFFSFFCGFSFSISGHTACHAVSIIIPQIALKTKT